MSEIYENFYRNTKKNPSKIFIYSLNKNYSGKDCQNLLKKTIEFIKLNKIRKIGIKSINSIDWIILYLAADKLCNQIFVIKNNFSKNVVKKLKNKYKIDYIATTIPKKLIKLKKRNVQKKTESDRADILFTSGTTDIPKGVIIKINSILHVIKILINKFRHKNNDLELLSMPFDHSFGLVRLRCCLYIGSKILVNNGLINFPSIFYFSKHIKITGLSLVPSGIQIIKNLLKNKIQDFSQNLKYFEIGSSTINFETRKWLKKNFKKTNILHHYGMTEASRSFLIKRGLEDNLKLSNDVIGNSIDGCYYKLSESPRGELLLKGKNLFYGYLHENENKKKFENRWYRTGDIFEKNNKKLKFLGRKDNQLNIGGNKVQAEYIENLIEKLSSVNKCQCIQVNDKIYNKRLSLYVEKKASVKKKTVISAIKKNLSEFPDYYHPKFIVFKKIKLTKNGKKIRRLR